MNRGNSLLKEEEEEEEGTCDETRWGKMFCQLA